MAITSYGYAGTILPNAPWALMQKVLGQEYFVEDANAAKVTAVTTGTREVQVGAGYIGGHGVLDYNSAPVTIQLPNPTGSTTQWFMIMARRTWGTSQSTFFGYINAGTGATLPARSTNPGTQDDQPLALVAITPGQSVPTAVRDLRAVGFSKGGPYMASDDLVRSYMTRVGTVLRIGSATWTRTSTDWERAPGPTERIALPTASGSGLITPASGWSILAPMICTGTRNGNTTDLFIELRRSATTKITVPTDGTFSDIPLGQLVDPTRFAPNNILPFAFEYFGGAAADNYGSFMGLGVLRPTGALEMVAGTAGQHIQPQPSSTTLIATRVSVRLHLSFLRADATPTP